MRLEETRLVVPGAVFLKAHLHRKTYYYYNLKVNNSMLLFSMLYKNLTVTKYHWKYGKAVPQGARTTVGCVSNRRVRRWPALCVQQSTCIRERLNIII